VGCAHVGVRGFASVNLGCHPGMQGAVPAVDYPAWSCPLCFWPLFSATWPRPSLPLRGLARWASLGVPPLPGFPWGPPSRVPSLGPSGLSRVGWAA